MRLTDSPEARYRVEWGLTLIELVLIMALLGVVATITMPSMLEAVRDLKVKRAIEDMRVLDFEIDQFDVDNETFPMTLEELEKAPPLDPWGRQYVYFLFVGPGWKGKARKDRFLVPINTYYDLYSMGADGESAIPLTAGASFDDVIRANDGHYYGLAEDY